MNEKNIVLVGFMGCGKSSIGKRLSDKLGKSFVDSDVEIKNSAGLDISEIFNLYGESYFRKLERNFCKLYTLSGNKIIATGGGIIKNRGNIETLKINGIVVYLKSTPQKIYTNIRYDYSRPLLNVEDKFSAIKELLEQRIFYYENYSDIIVDVSETSIEESCNMIIKSLEKEFI